MTSFDACPKCSHPTTPGALECPACGIVYAKFRAPGTSRTPGGDRGGDGDGEPVNPYAPPRSELIQEAMPEPGAEGVDPKLVGIGGWLILPAIGLVLGPLVGLIGLLVLVSLFPQLSAEGHGGVLTAEILAGLVLVLLQVYAATRFFGKKRNLPAVMTVLYAAGVAAAGILLAIELTAGAQEFATESGKQLARAMMAAVVWVPYFHLSKRVQATFVR